MTATSDIVRSTGLRKEGGSKSTAPSRPKGKSSQSEKNKVT